MDVTLCGFDKEFYESIVGDDLSDDDRFADD
jgi:hypothetical protein